MFYTLNERVKIVTFQKVLELRRKRRMNVKVNKKWQKSCARLPEQLKSYISWPPNIHFKVKNKTQHIQLQIHKNLPIPPIPKKPKKERNNYRSERWLTSIEHPIIDSRSTALSMMSKRFGGGLPLRSNISVTPPVKSTIASLLEPPVRFSYEPFTLQVSK